MIAWAPGRVPAGKVSDAVWANWDISPTFCKLTGARPPTGIDGIDGCRLQGRSSAPALPRDRYLFWQFNEGELRQAVMQGDWKLIRFKKPAQPERLELYDLRTDIGEATNLAEANPAKVQALLLLMRGARSPAEHPLFNWQRDEQ